VRILAIDAALAASAAAVLDTDGDHVVAAERLRMERGHAEALMPMLARVLVAAKGLADIDRIAVTTGPGSFTGIRVGLAAARGLALATGKPLVGITTLAALAAPHLVAGEGRAVAAAIDARHGRVYFQMFTPAARNLVPARLVGARDAARSTGAGPVILVGSGAEIVAAAGSPNQFRILAEADVPDPAWVARLGAAAPLPERPPRPLYLRPADAKPPAESTRIARH
jgi:tRNA threonylcarbamoyladenosine biosynthesis protein TsaB